MIITKFGYRPDKLTDQAIATILHYARQDLSINNAARHAYLCEETVQKWMGIGKEDKLNDKDSFLAQFYGEVRKNQSEYISEALKMIKSGSKNWQGLAWILKQCFSEEFGEEAVAYKDLLALCHQLMAQFNDQKLTHGAISNGRQVHQISD